jgi:hypothetical protein
MHSMHTDEYPYRSPATIASLRSVTLRPHLSISLPSGDDYSVVPDQSQSSTDEWLNLRINGGSALNQTLLCE